MPDAPAYAESIASRNTVATHIRALSQAGKPTIDIALNDGGQVACARSYSTLDKVEGEVAITAPRDARFDDVFITFEGNTKVFMDTLSAHASTSRIEASYRFLRLNQPIPSSSYPVPRVAEAGRTYKFPFTFTIPQQLVEQICRHECESNQVHDEHLQLPPSLGGSSLSSDGVALPDDMAPDMTRISYAIKVKVVRNRESDGKPVTLAENTRKVHVIPASEEHPPLSIEDGHRDGYVLRREKDLKKGMFKGRLGRLTVEAAQPRSLRLPPPTSGVNAQPTTMATVKLRFDPASDNAVPPKLDTLVSKLKVYTFFSTRPMDTLPCKEDAFYSLGRAAYSTTVQLSSRCIESVRWERHEMSELDEDRRDSCLSTSTSGTNISSSSGSSGRSSVAKRGVIHTANILVPITLPKSKTFPPTFHSCLVSRVYVLELSLSTQASGSNISNTTLTLKIPIQVSAAGNVSYNQQAESEIYGVDEFFNPRSVAPPAADLVMTSPSILQGRLHPPGDEREGSGSQLPPSYSFLAGANQGVPVRIPNTSPGRG